MHLLFSALRRLVVVVQGERKAAAHALLDGPIAYGLHGGRRGWQSARRRGFNRRRRRRDTDRDDRLARCPRRVDRLQEQVLDDHIVVVARHDRDGLRETVNVLYSVPNASKSPASLPCGDFSETSLKLK